VRTIRGGNLFPQETNEFTARYNFSQRAIALTCAMVGLGLDNAEIAKLRGTSVKTVEIEIMLGVRLLQAALNLSSYPTKRQLVIICWDVAHGQRPQFTLPSRGNARKVGGLFRVEPYCLTPAVAEICALVAFGLSNQQMAGRQGKVLKTVEAQISAAKDALRKVLNLPERPTSRCFTIICHEIAAGRVPEVRQFS
jgi:DNA-binding NarL/FixJ family response regulator